MTRAETEALWKKACRQSQDADLATLEMHWEIFARFITAHCAERLKGVARALDHADWIARGRHTVEAQLVYDLIEEMEAEAK